ncbi:MAG: iron ABC transporter permease [Trueperaceae bacterium]|nr:iron ABC transporter permease [Trueperaceae bacterium]
MSTTLTHNPSRVVAERAGRDLTRPGALLGRVVLLLGLGLLIVYPLVMVVGSVFFAEAWGARPLSLADLSAGRVVAAWRNTLVLGGLVTVISVLFALPAALLAYRSRLAWLVDVVMTVPFLTPPFLVSLAWLQVTGRRGYASRLGLDGVLIGDLLISVGGMAVLMAVNYAPLVYFALRAQLSRLPSGLTWAAAVAGAGRWTRLFTIVLPLMVPALLAGGFLAFASAIGEYGTPLVIGQRIGFPVVATEIARLVSVYPIDLSLASALGSTLVVVGAGAYWLSRVFRGYPLKGSTLGPAGAPPMLGVVGRIIAVAVTAFFALVGVVVPLASLATTSLLRLISAGPVASNLTVANFVTLFEPGAGGMAAISASLSLALVAAGLGLFLGLLAARAGRAAAFLATLPVAIPAITMAVGFIRGWNAPWLAQFPVYGTGTILALYYLAQYLPFVVQYVQAGQAGMPSSYEAAARVHGANPRAALLHVSLPLLWPHALAGAIMMFSIGFRELVGSVLLRPPSVQTSSTFIMQQFDQGSIAVGTAMGLVAIVAALLATLTARLFGGRTA